MIGNDGRDQLLFKFAYIYEPNADAGVLKAVYRLAAKRQFILVWQLDLKAKFIARVKILFPVSKTTADAYLLKQRLVTFTVLGNKGRRDI